MFIGCNIWPFAGVYSVKQTKVGESMKRGRDGWRKCGRMIIAVCAMVIITATGFNGAIAEGDMKNGAQDVVHDIPLEEVEAVLLDEAPEDKLCIGILPTQAGGIMKYYVPDVETSAALHERISSLDAEKIGAAEMLPEWARTAWDYNIAVKYGEYTLRLCEGGVMRIDRMSKDYTDFDEWVVKDQDAADFIMDIVRRDTGLSVFDAESICNVVKAELAFGPLYGGDEKESIVLTDADKLAEIEGMLSNAEKCFWSKCPFGNCRLVLTTQTGDEITLAVASDSCTVFYADGCFFDYMPEEYRDEEEHPDNSVLFGLFGITAEYFIQ